MSGPKHLWSGDWESDSDRAHEQLAAQSPPSFEPETPEEPTAPGGRRRRPSRRMLATLVVSALVLAGVGVTLGETLGGSSNPKHGATAGQTRTSPWTVTSASPGNGPSGGAPVMTPHQDRSERAVAGHGDRHQPLRHGDQHGQHRQHR